MRSPSILALVAAAALAAPAVPQEAGPGAGHRNSDPSEMVVKPYAPRVYAVNDLFGAARQLFGDSVRVMNSEVPHFVVLGELLLVHDVEEDAARICAALADLEQSERERREAQKADPTALNLRAGIGSGGDGDAEVATETRQFRPRYVSIETLQSTLVPFVRDVRTSVQRLDVIRNVNPIKEAQVVVVHETGERMKQLAELVDRVDQPVPQMNVVVTLVRAAAGPEQFSALPEELVRHLKHLVKAPGFISISTGMLRCATQSSQQCSLQMKQPGGVQWSLRFFPEAFDPEAGELSLRHCEFELALPASAEGSPVTQSFNTSLTIRAGEFVVLGGVGESPTFVVLRAEPIASVH